MKTRASLLLGWAAVLLVVISFGGTGATALPIKMDTTVSLNFTAELYENSNFVRKLTRDDVGFSSEHYDLRVVSRPGPRGCYATASLKSKFRQTFQPTLFLEHEGAISCVNVQTAADEVLFVCVRLRSCM